MPDVMKVTWRDQCLVDMPVLSHRVLEEHIEQIVKWGIQEHTPCEWLAILMEETGSLSKAILEARYRDGTLESIRREAIQVATLALKIAEMV